MKRGWSGSASGLVLSASCVIALGVAGCGGSSGSGRLSSADYTSDLAKISKQSDTAHAAVEQGAPNAKTVAQVQTLLRRFASARTGLAPR